MKYTKDKLSELRKELKTVLMEVESGRISRKEAADRILLAREEMDKVVKHLQSGSN